MRDRPDPTQQAAPSIRAAEPGDVEELHRFVLELAEAEQFPGEVTAAPEGLRQALFGTRPVAEAVVATVGDQPVGFALYYWSYSTILGRPGLHLEDLYVRAEHRGSGVGLSLLAHLAGLAVDRGCGRMEWWVLRTNEPALRFYRRLQARGLDEIEVMRLAGESLRALAGHTTLQGCSPHYESSAGTLEREEHPRSGVARSGGSPPAREG